MPHATTPQEAQDEEDERVIQQALSNDPQFNLDDVFNKELEVGEKAEGAVDYGDLSDDDLADEVDGDDVSFPPIDRFGVSDNSTKGVMQEQNLGDLGGQEAQDELDDLFGDDPSSPPEVSDATSQIDSAFANGDRDFRFEDEARLPQTEVPPAIRQDQRIAEDSAPQRLASGNKDAMLSREEKLQRDLFAVSRLGLGAVDDLPVPPQNKQELLAQLWPKFKRDATPQFMDLLPPKRAKYVERQKPKPPRPVNPTKINLEIAQDDEKAFKVSSGSNKRTYDEMEKPGLVVMQQDTKFEESSDEDIDMDSDYEKEAVGGVSWQDLQVICEDWDVHAVADSDIFNQMGAADTKEGEGDDKVANTVDRELDEYMEWPSCKRRKVGAPGFDTLQAPRFAFLSMQNPEQTTASISKKITLDLNDPHLLIDSTQGNDGSRVEVGQSGRKAYGRGAFSKSLNQRYNVSNDEAYDLLKENHQNKIRGMLGNPAVEHSSPAVRLQWPFYKTKMDKSESRSFHRPLLRVAKGEQIAFDKPISVKKKSLKGKAPQIIFAESKDLSLGDNSNLLMLEYSEEYPTILSNLGMANRVINYYRRKTMDDHSRPKLDIGETTVLLPQDKSPFALFGHIDPGEVTPAIYNGMFRAPIFKHQPKNTDFMIVRSSTGVDGSTWYLRNIDHLQAVGQEFPSVDIPGPHSRKVTTAAKNRLKMISYRLVRSKKSHRISVGDVTEHFIDTSDMQNRQKMKEFMQFDKDNKEWRMRPGESVPEEDVVRSMVKPEDVCLLESMQVGQQHLQDAGFSKDDDDQSEGDDTKEGQNVEQQLAPWFTSRNFLHATQGKAMLQLHGEGDPTGRGEAFSFIKTSMKGGFRAMGESAIEKMDKKNNKDSGGHSYNVARQQQAYEESIRKIWDAQKYGLSSTVERSDSEMEDDDGEASDSAARVATPRSEARTPATIRRRDDETGSQSTRMSTNSQAGKILKITRTILDEYGEPKEEEDVHRNPRVIRHYLKRRHAKLAEQTQYALEEIIWE